MADTKEKLFDLMMRDPCPSPVICDPNCKYYKSHHCHAERYADHLIANGVTIQEWIPVTERLPEHDGRYLCNVKYFSFQGSFYQAILEYDKHGFQEGHIYTDDVTHWMPLPTPPKGE